ncbi:MAG: AAA family ATPase [Betaproteobacteria bacterium]|nr:AAA family ATPase [Betaproteobacteria bacterium]
MNCAKCGHGNAADARFCGQCGTRLVAACPSCGAANPPGNRFCGACGAPLGTSAPQHETPSPTPPRHLAERILQSRHALEGERKQVTVLFADMKGSMELLADRDPEEARKLLDPVLERMMAAVHHYEGTVNQVMGDGIMALFGAPLAHEDHAVRACFAALRMQEAVRRYTEDVRAKHGVEIQIRVGLNSGEVVVRSIGSDLRMDYTAVGQTTHLAARMEQLATPGTIRVTSGTLALAEGYIAVRSIGPVPVKGLAQPVEVYELTGAGTARTRLQVARARGLTRFVGRDMEMDQLRRASENARAGRGQVIAVVGEPGVGKSRLYYEFLQSHHAREFLVLESGSVSYGKATPFLPLADLLRSYFRIDAHDDVRGIRVKVTGGLLTLDESLKDAVPVALWLLDALPEESPFLALEPAERRRQTFAAVKRILLRENEARPLILVFEDLHWIDGETQAFLDGLIDSVPAARVLLAVNYRPEYRHGWGNRTYYHQLRVDPLPPESAEDLLAGLLGADPSVAALKPLLIARTEGRPLFLEESVRMLVETGALAGERGAYRLVRAPEALQVPATVQAILASRIDRLEPEDKRLLQAAAVVGTHVPFAVLQAIVEAGEDELRRSLARLQTAEFMYEARLFPELEYAFKHALTHEVAYGSVLQERRQQLHRAAVEAIERIYADRIAEQIERLAHHAVNAGVQPKAARYLREAGAKAVGRSASRDARGYFEQALALLREMPPSPEALREELETLIAYGPALMELKSPASPEVETLYRRALELVEQLGVESRRFTALWGLWYMHFNRGHHEVARDAGEKLLDLARRGDDSGLLLEAHHALWPTLSGMGQPLRAILHAEQGVALYDRERHAGYTHLYAGHDPGACCRYHLSLLRWLAGYPERALRELKEAFRLAEELKHPLTTVITLWFAAWLHHQRGERELSLASCEKLLELAKAHGFARWSADTNTVHLATRTERLDSGMLAECRKQLEAVPSATWRKVACHCTIAGLCAQQGLAAEGLQVLHSIPEENRRMFVAPEFRRIEGELLLKQDNPARSDAERCFNDAIELAHSRSEKSLELRAATSLARLLASQGRRDEARGALEPVYGWFTEGFGTADLKSARALLDELGAV